MTLEDLERASARLKGLPHQDEYLRLNADDHSPKATIVRQLHQIAGEHVDAARARRYRPMENAALPDPIPEELRSEAEHLPHHHEQEAVARYMAAIDDVHDVLETLCTG